MSKDSDIESLQLAYANSPEGVLKKNHENQKELL